VNELRPKWDALGVPVMIALVSGLLTLGLGFASLITVENYFPVTFGEIWNRWDTLHYLDMVRHGYSQDAEWEHLTVFFPLYPTLIYLGTFVFPDATISALVVSNAAFAVALVFLSRLAALDFSPQCVELAVVFSAFFPTAYFFHLGYTESLYFALSIASFYMARKGNWVAAGILGFFVATTRLPGLALAVALAVEYLHQKRFRFREVRWDCLWTQLPFTGFGVYLLINQIVFGSPFMFLEVQKQIYARELGSPLTGLINDWEGLFTGSPATRFLMSGSDIVAFVFTLVVLVWSAVKLRPSYTVYAVLLWLLTFCYGFWMSVPRLILVIFPMYFFLACLTEKRPALRYSLFFACLFPYVLGTLQFARGWWAH